MSNNPETVRVIATDVASQGLFVVMNKADFDPAIHRMYSEDAPAEDKPRRGRPPKSKSEEANHAVS